MKCASVLVLSSALFPSLVIAASSEADRQAFFEQKIRPVLAQHCYSCHSQDAQKDKKLKANLFLDSRDGTHQGGESGPALVPGKSAESLLFRALKYDGLEMPPAGRLPDEVIADFAKWIDEGAFDPRSEIRPAAAKRQIDIEEGRQFWSFQPLRAVTPPLVPDDSLVRTPIDRFILAKQLEHGLKPNGPAAREKLIRRVYFDLVGLPPTPEQVAAFLSDASSNAFEKVVDELLASDRYGERWARHWLDVARYAESGGYEFDGFRPGAYHYRDWVIRSLNCDLPYDEFLRMQLAGDNLAPDDYHGAAATGFLVAGPYPGQITAKTVERIRYDQLDDMLMTIGGSMLGLTLGCVRCHEHKYDPIPQQDYYALAAALATTAHGTQAYDPDPAVTQRALEQHRREHEPLDAALQKFAQEQLPPKLEHWRNNGLPQQPESPRWQILEPTEYDAERSWLKSLPGGVLVHDGQVTSGTMLPRKRRKAREAEEYTVTALTHQKNIAALRLDTLTDKTLPRRGPGLNGDGSFQLAELKVTARPVDRAAPDKPVALVLKPVFAAFEDKDQPLSNAVDGKPGTAWVVRENAGKDNAAIFEIEGNVPVFASGTELTFELRFRDQGVGRLRLAVSTEPNPATWAGDIAPQHLGEIRAILVAHQNQVPEEKRLLMARWFSPFDKETESVFRAVVEHQAREPRPPFTELYTTVAGGQDVYFLRRGEVDNKDGKASPGFLQVLWRKEPAAAHGASSGAASPSADPRIALAQWITDSHGGAGALAARVVVNRLWQHHFGEGLVGTPNDFGAQGERPSHPELLEWLATELVQGGWKLKRIHKLIVLSGTYQQSHEVQEANQKLDPENRYFWHHRPRRLEAEIIRDAMLSVGNSLDLQMYGPSVLDNSPRRSIYLRVKRSELLPVMTMFDAPEPTQSIGERVSTTVPTQALAMMNSQEVRRIAERLAQRTRPTPEVPLATAVDQAYQIAFARLPDSAERDRMLQFIDQQKVALAGDAMAESKALIEGCQVLLCLNEFVYVD